MVLLYITIFQTRITYTSKQLTSAKLRTFSAEPVKH